MSHPRPAPGALVGLVLRDGRELYGHVLDVKTMSGRWPVMLLGTGKSMTVDPSDVLAVEALDLPPERVRDLAEKQRAELDPNVAHGRRVNEDRGNQQRRQRTMRARLVRPKE